MLCCIACIVLYCTVLYRIVLYSIVLFCIALCYSLLCNFMLYIFCLSNVNILFYMILHYIIFCYIILDYYILLLYLFRCITLILIEFYDFYYILLFYILFHNHDILGFFPRVVSRPAFQGFSASGDAVPWKLWPSADLPSTLHLVLAQHLRKGWRLWLLPSSTRPLIETP